MPSFIIHKMKIPGLTPRNLRISISFIVLVALVIFLITFSKDTLIALRKINPVYFILLFMVWVVYAVFDGLKLKFLALSVGEENLDLFSAIKTIQIGIFLAAVVPFQVAGLPVQIYILSRHGISPGKGAAILTMRGIVSYGVIVLAMIFALKYIWPPESNIIRGVITYAVFVVIIVFIIYIVAILSPGIVPKFTKNEKIIKEFRILRETFLTFVKTSRKKELLLALIFTIISFLALTTIPYLLSRALSNAIPYLNSFIFQTILQGSLVFTPTPGGSGIAETAAYFLFRNSIKKEILGVFVILWRFFTAYLTALVGGIFLLREINVSENQEISQD